MQQIVTLTFNATIDITTSVAAVVAEQKLRCELPRYSAGGGGITVSRAIQRLGGNSTALYLAGGPTGTLLSELIEREQLRHQPVPMSTWTRESFMVTETGSGHQYHFNLPGPSIPEVYWGRCLTELSQLTPTPTYIVASGSVPPGMPKDVYGMVAEIARDLEAQVILDTSGPALAASLSEPVFMIKPNLAELGQLVGRPLQDAAEAIPWARDLVARERCEIVVVSLGQDGALLVSADSVEQLAAPQVTVQSEVGAGDSMVGAIVLALSRGWNMLEAVRFGVAAGTATVMLPAAEICRREDAEQLYRQLGGTMS